MNITLNKNVFKAALDSISGCIGDGVMKPILKNFKLDITGNNVKLLSSDLERSAICNIFCEEMHPNELILLPMDKITSILNNWGEDTITMKGEPEKIKISGKKSKYSIQCDNDFDAYPEIWEPDQDSVATFIINAETLKEIILKTTYIIKTEKVRLVLSGVLIKISDGILTAVATDGRRLSIITTKVSSGDLKTECIIPGKSLIELNRILTANIENPETKIDCFVKDKNISFALNNIIFSSQLIDGKYPDIEQLIPKEVSTTLNVNRKVFLAAVKSAAIFVNNEVNAIKLTTNNREIKLESEATDIGNSSIVLDAEENKDEVYLDFKIKLNSVFLTQSLDSINEDIVRIGFVDSFKPLIIEQLNKDILTYMNILMPLTLEEENEEKEDD